MFKYNYVELADNPIFIRQSSNLQQSCVYDH